MSGQMVEPVRAPEDLTLALAWVLLTDDEPKPKSQKCNTQPQKNKGMPVLSMLRTEKAPGRRRRLPLLRQRRPQ